MKLAGQKIIGLLLGPLFFVLVYFFIEIPELSDGGRAILASTLWVGTWWLTEAIPIEVSALLPIILFPMMGSLSIKETTFLYSHPLIYLFLGGFIIALAIEKWNLHTRIALNIVHLIGSRPSNIVLGFMVATAFLSMWISNTASTLMMVPIGISVVQNLNSNEKFSKALLLSIAYSASIGGMATLIGTPPNVYFAGVVKETFEVEIGFLDWMTFGFPFSICLLGITWIILTKVVFKLSNEKSTSHTIGDQLKQLGKITSNEKKVLIIFSLTAFCWISRRDLLNPFFPHLTDTIIAMIGAISLFVIPSNNKEKLMKWEDVKNLPWGILLLFGGGLSIANGFVKTDLAQWIGLQLNSLSGVQTFVLILLIATIVNFLTEFTSNIATSSMILPILAALAISIETHPYYLMVGAILAASCAFMLPVATAPNAIVFGSQKVKMSDMVRSGLILNILSILLISFFVYVLMPIIWELDYKSFIPTASF